MEGKQKVLVVGTGTEVEEIRRLLDAQDEVDLVLLENGEREPEIREINKRVVAKADLVELDPEEKYHIFATDPVLIKPPPRPLETPYLPPRVMPDEHRYGPRKRKKKFKRTFPGMSRPLTKPGPKKPGRNEPCPCGSGKKYKKCCGG